MNAGRACHRCGQPICWHDILHGWLHRAAPDAAECGRGTCPKAVS